MNVSDIKIVQFLKYYKGQLPLSDSYSTVLYLICNKVLLDTFPSSLQMKMAQ